MSYIENLFFIDAITKIEKEVGCQYKTIITNVSHWDPSPHFQKIMTETLLLENMSVPWNYIYSYTLPIKLRKEVMKKLGFPYSKIENYMALFLQSGTQAIVNVVNLIKQYNYKKVCILKPAYFSVSHTFDILDVNYNFEDIIIDGNEIKVPFDIIKHKEYDCLWITSPIFSTGAYLSREHFNEITSLLKNDVLVVTDESFAIPGQELIRRLQPNSNLISIYCPHKAVAMNNVKFSIIICHLKYEDILEQWMDIISGALSKSNYDAVHHFVSSNYDYCYDVSSSYILKNKNLVKTILSTYEDQYILNPDIAMGQYVTVLCKSISSDVGKNIEFIYKMINVTKASFYPSHLNGLSNDKLGFRINLTLSPSDLKYSLFQIAEYLKSMPGN